MASVLRGGHETPRTLVVEDDVRTADLIAVYLRHAGHRVTTVHDGASGLRQLSLGSWDLIVLDRMLPGADGLAVCRAAAKVQGCAVIFVSALTLEEDRLAGFEAGGDDYITKPFSPRELVARAAAVLRRHQRAGVERTHVLRAGPLQLFPEERRALLSESSLDLTPSEFELLRALVERVGRGMSRSTLLERLPGPSAETLPRTVDVHIMNLRRKLGDVAGQHPVRIETVASVGYRLVVE